MEENCIMRVFKVMGSLFTYLENIYLLYDWVQQKTSKWEKLNYIISYKIKIV